MKVDRVALRKRAQEERTRNIQVEWIISPILDPNLLRSRWVEQLLARLWTLIVMLWRRSPQPRTREPKTGRKRSEARCSRYRRRRRESWGSSRWASISRQKEPKNKLCTSQYRPVLAKPGHRQLNRAPQKASAHLQDSAQVGLIL